MMNETKAPAARRPSMSAHESINANENEKGEFDFSFFLFLRMAFQ